jgi:hypothetical protein
LPGYDSELSQSSEADPSEKSEEENKLSAGQMELFAG